MATKKTKNTRNATEYIDSAGVKLNNNADLIIEANAAGTVTSCRDAVTGTEYVGGGGSVGVADIVIENNAAVIHNATELFNRMQSKEPIIFNLIKDDAVYFFTPTVAVIVGGTKGIFLYGISLATFNPSNMEVNKLILDPTTDTFGLM